MAAFYFDKIRITKNPGASKKYDFEATSNEGFASSGNPVNANVDIDNGDCEFIIPDGEANLNEVSFPKISVDFGLSIYTADKRFEISNKYPEFDDICDYKGGFSVKDTKYPPPRQKSYSTEYFDKRFAYNSMYAFTPKISMPVAIINRFEFTSIELTRVLDKTYTAKIELKDIGVAALYTESGMYVIPDKSRNNRSILILAVQRSGAPKTNLLFDRPDLYLPLGECEMPIVIYDATDEPVSSVALKDVGWKNASLFFD